MSEKQYNRYVKTSSKQWTDYCRLKLQTIERLLRAAGKIKNSKEFAESIYISPASWNNVKNDLNNANPSLEMVIDCCKVHNVSPNYFFNGIVGDDPFYEMDIVNHLQSMDKRLTEVEIVTGLRKKHR